MCRPKRTVVLLLSIFSVAVATAAGPDLGQLDVELHTALPLNARNADLFTNGGVAAVDLELKALPALGVQFGPSAMFLSQRRSEEFTTWLGARAGLRMHWNKILFPLSGRDGWIDLHGNYGRSGSVQSFGGDIGIGYEFPLSYGFKAGPSLRYMVAYDPLGDHAQLFMAGLSMSLFNAPAPATPAPVYLVQPSVAPETPPDADQDAVLDVDDQCPATPQGGRPDSKRPGCPAIDTDFDGVYDVVDVCPMEPAGARPDADNPGCPIRDTDKDTVPDAVDLCPDVPAGARPDPKRLGCPAGDRDGDNVLDSADRCPDQHHGRYPDTKKAGCPEPDGDGDSVPDRLDRCPREPGAPSRNADTTGCAGLVRVVGGQIRVMKPVFFETNSDVILGESNEVLSAVVEAAFTLHITRIRMAGHTDNQGADRYNLDLSRRRAQAVLRWLTDHGIDGNGLEAVGFGKAQPITTNETPEGRAQNRRVEFHILDAAFQQAPTPLTPPPEAAKPDSAAPATSPAPAKSRQRAPRTTK